MGRLIDWGEAAEFPRFEFDYIHGALKAQKIYGFAPFHAFPALEKSYASRVLFPLFQNRLMPSSRPEYERYLERLGVDNSDANPVTVLSRSEGRRATDQLEFFGMPDQGSTRKTLQYYFFVRGVRHLDGAEEQISRLATGDELFLRVEPDNVVDHHAILVAERNGTKLGYVPAYLLEDAHHFLNDSEHRPRVLIERVNPLPAPVHHRLNCRLEWRRPDDFLPFSTERYDPILDFRPCARDLALSALGNAS